MILRFGFMAINVYFRFRIYADENCNFKVPTQSIMTHSHSYKMAQVPYEFTQLDCKDHNGMRYCELKDYQLVVDHHILA